MTTLQDLIDFAKKHKVNPKQCVMLLHQECANGDIELDYFDEYYLEFNARVLNEDDEFEDVKVGMSLEQLEIPIG